MPDSNQAENVCATPLSQKSRLIGKSVITVVPA